MVDVFLPDATRRGGEGRDGFRSHFVSIFALHLQTSSNTRTRSVRFYYGETCINNDNVLDLVIGRQRSVFVSPHV